MTNKEFADYLFPNIKDWTYYEEKYPKRRLKEGTMVTRFAPSPTGFVHMGSLYAAFISNQFARQTDGIFYLRIEDTDQKRMVENGIRGILNDLQAYQFDIKEDPIQGGEYGPYIQSERKEIYHAYVKHLLEEGHAYPCFLKEAELEHMRKEQETLKKRIGCYGEYAKYRNLDLQEAKQKIENQEPYVIRLRSTGNFNKKVLLEDCIKGTIEFPENDMDIVLLKKDGLPTYHFAHAIDDHLMHTTHVIRGDEWLSSYPIHYELFSKLGFDLPKYAHLAPLTKKEENGNIRKLSKRYDPECSITYYEEEGIPKQAVKLYLATIMNSNFEEWYEEHQEIDDFTFEFSKMAIGGSLFDLQKLTSLSKIYLSRVSANQLYEEAIFYMKKYNQEFYELLRKYPDYSIALFNIERNIERPRMDLSCYKEIPFYYGYMYDEIFYQTNPYQNVTKEYDIQILISYVSCYEETDTEEIWMQKLKEMTETLGYASNMKAYKNNPSNYKGSLKDVCEVIRVALTGRNQTPNLYDLLKLLGKEKMKQRFQFFIDTIK